MTARILDGKSLATGLREALQARTSALREQTITASLRVVTVGEDEATNLYANRLRKSGESLSIRVVIEPYPASISESALAEILQRLNRESDLDGVVVGMPLPPHLSVATVSRLLDPSKDVDGITIGSAGRLYLDHPSHVPSTAAAVLYILKQSQILVAGKRAVVVGRSAVVGKPVALLLLQEQATVTIAHSRTRDLDRCVGSGDIVVSAVGRAGLIRGSMLRPGAVVIDAGINPVEGGIVGDVAFEEAVEVASAITPVPGGVGPLTNMMLLGQVINNAERRSGLD